MDYNRVVSFEFFGILLVKFLFSIIEILNCKWEICLLDSKKVIIFVKVIYSTFLF